MKLSSCHPLSILVSFQLNLPATTTLPNKQTTTLVEQDQSPKPMADQLVLIPYSASIIEGFIHKLTTLASTDYVRVHGLNDNFERLGREIEALRLYANDMPEQQLIINRYLKDMVHHADDIFDEIATEILRLDRRMVRSFFSCINGFVFRSQIAHIIDMMGETFYNIRTIFQRYSYPPTNLDGARETNSNSFNESDIIGREDEKRKIISLLMQPSDGNQNVSLITVVGMGGIGKTVVAKMVCNDAQVQDFFDICLWVHVSYDFDVKTIANKMLDFLSTGSKSNHQESLETLQIELHKQLNGKKYLLVLDDIWNESYEKWTELKTCLMCGDQHSKILVTTRSEKVAEVMEVRTLVHLKSLSEEDSWSLFKKLVFGDDNNPKIHLLEPVGKKIVKKCSGVPLAIKMVAEVLFSKDTESEWINVLEGGFWKLGESINDININIMYSLALSYQHLSPPQLKQCFAYCSIYPMGWEIEKNELIQLWMAQDYLLCLNGEKEMEDVGNGFVDTLLKMSFFQDPKIDEYGNLVSFKMHGLIHDLALEVAKDDYYLDSQRNVKRPTHICLSLDSNAIELLGSISASRLRTFLLQRTSDRGTGRMTRELSVILTFKSLRALNLSHSSLKMLPDLVGNLTHLRYLDLSWCVKLARLPKSIGDLVNLQTLKLTGCETLEFSTKVVTKLINLRNLEIDRCKAFEDMMPDGLGKLSSLQSLSNFYVVDDKKKKAGKLNDLQYLNNLRGSLQISTLDQVRDVKLESQGVNLKVKKFLDSLDLNWENQDKTEDSLQLLENLRPHQNLRRLQVRWYPGDKFSNWLSEINHLSYISLFGFDNCKSLPPLENLPYLKSLEISSMKVLEYIYLEEVFHTAATFFPSLERLKFSGCKNFKGWKRMEGQVSVDKLSQPPLGRLSQLIINKCPKLTDLPTFPNVEELQLCESMVKPLKETLDMASTSSSSTPLSMLKSLKIEGKLPDISVLPSRWKQNLTSLEHLEIGDVDNLDIWFEHGFPSLQKVVIYGCDLKALPSTICDLRSLQDIEMMGCHKLASLPKEMVQLTNLVTLEIWDCPLLVDRCLSETGVDWLKVKHVPNIILRQNFRR